jgi:pyridoxamine 5'-phosphate oxidase
MPKRDLSHLREVYQLGTLELENCHEDPFVQFDRWFHQALDAAIFEPNAMTLATANRSGQPSARIVLLKNFSHEGFIFYTNYESKKGQEMAVNDQVSLLFWWREHQRQVRIDGTVSKIGREEASIYFHIRPVGSQIAASISPQSHVIPDRNFLDEKIKSMEEQYRDAEIPLPQNWGGYIVKPFLFEFWQGRTNRLHDRIEYIFENNSWNKHRLAP